MVLKLKAIRMPRIHNFKPTIKKKKKKEWKKKKVEKRGLKCVKHTLYVLLSDLFSLNSLSN